MAKISQKKIGKMLSQVITENAESLKADVFKQINEMSFKKRLTFAFRILCKRM